MNSFETVIFAQGEGSRMKELTDKHAKPKHLLPLGSETPVTRLARQLSPYSKSISCYVKPNQFQMYYEAFEKEEEARDCPLFIYEQVDKQKDLFTSIHEIFSHVPESTQILFTQGDLIFRDEEIERFFIKKDVRSKIHLAFDFNHGLPIRFVVSPKEIFDTLYDKNINLDSPVELGKFVVRNLWKEILSGKLLIHNIRTIANLNTPEDYDEAKRSMGIQSSE